MAKTITLILVAACIFSFSPALPGLLQVQSCRAQPAQPVPEQRAKPKISFKGGPGDTPETAVVITGAPNSMAGISAEYSCLDRKFGRRQVDWRLKRQTVLQQKGKVYDRMEIVLKGGDQINLVRETHSTLMGFSMSCNHG